MQDSLMILEGLNRLLILKIVSDHMDMKHHISANQVESLIKQKNSSNRQIHKRSS